MSDNQARGPAFTSPAAPGLRIGDAEREQAAELLGAHLRAGRLSVAEYDERLEQAFAARTEADLTPLFADLPGSFPLVPAPENPPRPNRSGRRAVPVRLFVLLVLVLGGIVSPAISVLPLLVLIAVLWFSHGRRSGSRRHHHHHHHCAGPRHY